MNRLKKIGILSAVLALCCIAVLVVSLIQQRQEAITESGRVILSLPAEDVQTLSWEISDTALAFHRDANGLWKWDEDEAFPLNQEALADMLSLFSKFSAAFTIEQAQTLSQYGLDDPQGTISLHTGDTTYTVTLGTFSKLDEKRYVTIGDGNVYLVNTDPMDTYDVTLDSLFAHDEIPLFEAVDSITFTGLESYTLSYREEAALSYSTEDVYFQEEAPLDTENVETYLRNLGNAELTSYVSYNATQEELTAYGLDEPSLSVTATHGESSVTLHIGLVTEQTEDGETETAAYARVGSSPIVYALTAADQTALLACSYDDLRHKAVFTAAFETVTALDITLEGESYHLAASVNEDGQTLWLYGEQELDMTAIQTKLTALSADSFTSAAPTGKEELHMVITLENDYADTLELALFRQDGTSCLCQVNGESVALISRTSAMALVEAINAIVLE